MADIVRADDTTPPDGEGHRARLRQRLFADADGLLDHELIEYLLALTIPRRDTKPLAKALLREFGGIGALLTADAGALMRVKGITETSAAALKIAQATALRLLRVEASSRPLLSNWQALIDYLRADMGHQLNERFRVLHLNTRNVLIRDEVMSEGSIDQSAVHVREVIRRAMDLGSASIILVHNHPSGDTSASRSDIDITRAIMEAARRLGIAVHDHLIITATGHRSLRSEGLI
ncbi:RadC family protein [Sphingomonas bacterium]|uniref:RadC family protein n=1 Tax=Sphingomonas bacterium TaxID=1895847 RepID=UPI0015750DC6|nr:DNA repair protein RadC [Sphingomonas bacterium]